VNTDHTAGDDLRLTEKSIPVFTSPAAKKKETTVAGDNVIDLNLRGFAFGVYYAYLEIDNGSTKQRSSLVKFVVLR